MNEIEEIKIENLIYNIRGNNVMLDSEISRTKCHNHLYDKLITHYDICEPISVFADYVIV